MTGVEVILAAVAAGGGDVAKKAVVDAYDGLRALLRRRLGHDPSEPTPEVLEGELVSSGADRDPEILAAAGAVLQVAGTVTVHDSKGVQIGNYNTQHNTFD